MKNNGCLHLEVKGTLGRFFVWSLFLENHGKLIRKGEEILDQLKNILIRELKHHVKITAPEPEYFEFEFIGMKFRTILEVYGKSLNLGMLRTYLIKEKRNGTQKLIEIDCIKFGEGGAHLPDGKELDEIYLAMVLYFIEQYVAQTPIVLKSSANRILK